MHTRSLCSLWQHVLYSHLSVALFLWTSSIVLATFNRFVLLVCALRSQNCLIKISMFHSTKKCLKRIEIKRNLSYTMTRHVPKAQPYLYYPYLPKTESSRGIIADTLTVEFIALGYCYDFIGKSRYGYIQSPHQV